METVTLSSKGQLVIPSHVRATAHLQAGDVFEVRYLDGEIRLKPVMTAGTITIDEVAGCLSSLGTASSKPPSDAQVHAAIQARLKAEDTATLSSRGSRTAKSKKSPA